MRNYLLLTPGPLSTSETVKEAMLQDWCTWDKDYNEGIVTVIRKELLEVAGLDEKEYTTVLLQGSGTYGVEATLGAVVKPTDRLLIIANGAYGKRMAAIADYYKLDYVMVALKETELITPAIVEEALKNHPGISHLSLVHSETTTGLLNPIEEIAEVLRGRGITWIVDAMSSFGGIPIDMKKLGIDFLVSSANKCIQGVPGFTFVLASREKLLKCKGVARSLSLDIYAQWEEIITYTVIYTDGVDNAVIFRDQVYSGLEAGDPTPGFVGDPVRRGYKFAGWNPSVSKTVTGDVVYTATWEKTGSGIYNPGKGPKTGDESELALWTVLMLSAGAAAAGVVIYGRKKQSGK